MIIRTADGWKAFGTLDYGSAIQKALQSVIAPPKAKEPSIHERRVRITNAISEHVGVPYRIAVNANNTGIVVVRGGN